MLISLKRFVTHCLKGDSRVSIYNLLHTTAYPWPDDPVNFEATTKTKRQLSK